MSKNCYKIQYKGDTSNMSLNANWFENQNLQSVIYLDTDDQFEVELEKGVQELSDINKINVETVLGFSLPKTLKNICLLGQDVDFDSIDLPLQDHDICVSSGNNDLFQNKLSVISIEERIEVEIVDSTDFWLVALKSLYLDELQYGTFLYTKQNLLANMTTKAAYVTGDQGIYFPFVWYGAFSRTGKLLESDFRPLFHDKALFEKIFWKIGWSVNVPVLDTNVGRRLGSYLLKENFNEDESLLEQRKFRAAMGKDNKIISNSSSSNGTIVFPIEIFDNGNNYNNVTGIYSGSIYAEFIAELVVDLTIGDNGFWDTSETYVVFQMFHEKLDGTYVEVDNRSIKGNSIYYTDEKITLAANILLYPTERVLIKFNNGGNDYREATIKAKSVFYNKPISNVVQAGDELDIGKNLRHDLALDYIKGMVHLFNFKIYTDWVTRTVHFLTPYSVDYYTENVVGYLLDTLKDYKSKQVCDETKVVARQAPKKNRIYGFKESSDAYIKDFKYEKYEEPFQKFIDEGFDISETDYLLNPYFEPTLNANVEGLDGVGGLVDAPFMLDNLDGNVSYKIAPRKLIFYGMTQMFYPQKALQGSSQQSTGYNSIQVFLFGDVSYRLPYAFQVANQAIMVTGSYPNYNFMLPEWMLVYGNYSDDHYQKFYKRWERDYINRPQLILKLLLCEQDYLDEDFRERVLIDHNGNDVFGRAYKLKSKPCDKESEMLFIPDNQLSNDCIDFEEDEPCQNYPEIIVTKNITSGCWDFTIGGISASPIGTVIFKYKYLNSNTWITGTSFCGAVDTFQVQMEVSYTDGCPTLTRDQIVDACGNRPKICYSRLNDCLTISECGTNISPVSSVLIEYSTNDPSLGNPNWKIYTTCLDLKTFTANRLYIRLTVYYTGGCKSIVLTDLYPIDVNRGECPRTDTPETPSVVCIRNISGQFRFEKIGSYNGDAILDVIKWRRKGSEDEWKIYADETFTGTPCYEAQRVIIWCDRGCPNYCSEVIECDCTCLMLDPIDIVSSTSVCTSTMKWEHPDNATTNWKVVILNDQSYHVPTAKAYINTQCPSPPGTNSPIKPVEWDRWRFKTHFVWIWSPTQTITSITVHENNAGTITPITIPINVTYSTGDTNAFLINAITEQIETYLNTNHAAINGVDYELVIIILGTGTNRTLQFGFYAKHVVTTRWIGLQKSTDLMSVNSGTFIIGVTTQEIAVGEAPIISCYSPCGTEFKVRFNVGANQFIDNGLSDFDKLIPNATSPIVPNILTVATDTCTRATLTTSYVCGTSPMKYLWKNGGKVISTTNFAIGYSPATIRLMVWCDDCVFYRDITI